MAAKKGEKIKPSASFRFVPATKVPNVIFDRVNQGRVSLYLQALQHLLDHPDQLLEVDSVTAKGGIGSQAKKHGIKILFGEKDGKLYVRALEKESPEAFLLKLLEEGPLNLVEIEAELAKAHRGVNAQEIIGALSQNSKIALRSVAGSNVKKWHHERTPKAAT